MWDYRSKIFNVQPTSTLSLKKAISKPHIEIRVLKFLIVVQIKNKQNKVGSQAKILDRCTLMIAVCKSCAGFLVENATFNIPLMICVLLFLFADSVLFKWKK